jgi:ribosomal-protein-serine acetyltransferase
MFTLKVDHELELRLLQLQDSSQFFQLVEENRDHLRKWLPWVQNVTSPIDTESLLSLWQQQFAENIGCNFGIFYRGELVGSIGLHQIDWYNKFTSVGYFLAKKAERRGIMTRTVRTILNYAFFHLGLNRVEIRCGVNNNKSRAIPERLGFVLEGIVRQGENLSGHYHDLFLYSMLAREWLHIPVPHS